MKHYIDCEFNGLGGQLLSMGIVSETGRSLYVVMNYSPAKLDPWVWANVHPLMADVPIERITCLSLGLTGLYWRNN